MIDHIRALLAQWGDWVRSDKDSPRGLGYPEQAVGAEIMDKPPRRTEDREKEVERIATLARRTAVYRTNDVGCREKVHPMIPRSQPKDARGGRQRTPQYEPAPREILDCQEAVLSLPLQERNMIARKYVCRESIREAARGEGISQTEYRELLTRAEGHIRGRVSGAA